MSDEQEKLLSVIGQLQQIKKVDISYLFTDCSPDLVDRSTLTMISKKLDVAISKLYELLGTKEPLDQEMGQVISDAAFNKGYSFAKFGKDYPLSDELLKILDDSSELMRIYRDQYLCGLNAGSADKRD